MNSVQQKLIKQLRKDLGASEDTEHLIDWLEDSWETLEMLKERFGEAKAMQLYTASILSLYTPEGEALLV